MNTTELGQPILSMRHIIKGFGGNIAVNDVSVLMSCQAEVVALLGENGAGKSTLIKVLAGVYPRDSGDILFQEMYTFCHEIKSDTRQPIAFIHQDLGLIDWMTVAENMALVMGVSTSIRFD